MPSKVLLFPDSTGISVKICIPFLNILMHARLPVATIPRKNARYLKTLDEMLSDQSDPFPWRGIVQFHLSKKLQEKFQF